MRHITDWRRWTPVAMACVCAAAMMAAVPRLAAAGEEAPQGAGDQAVEPQEPEGNPAEKDAAAEVYAHFCAAMSRLRSRDSEGALDELKTVTVLDPTAAPAWFHIGSVYRQLGNHKDSAASYEKAVELRPDEYRYRFELGRVLFLMGKPDDGLQQWEKAAACAGDSAAFIFQKIAQYHKNNKNTDAAIKALDSAIRLSEEPGVVAEELATLQQKAGKWRDAVETYRYVMEHQANSDGLHLTVAACFEKHRMWKEALLEYDAFFAANPPGVKTYAVLMQAVEVARKAELPGKVDAYVRKSIEVVDAALAADDRSPAVYSRLAGLLARAGEIQKAIDVLTGSLEKVKGEQSIEIHVILGDVYLMDCRTDEAESEYLAALALDPEDEGLRGKLGSFYIGMLRMQDAADSFVRAAELADDKKAPVYRAALVQVFSEMKEYAKAEEQLLILLKGASDDNAPMWAAVAKVRKDAGRFQQCIEAIEKALAIGTDNPLVEAGWRLTLADAYAGLKQPDNEKQQHEAIAKLAKDPEVALQLGYILYELRYYEQSVAILEANVDKPGANKAAARSVLSRAYAKLADYPRAEKELDLLIKENPEDPSLGREKAQFLIGRKRFDEARKALDAAAAFDKDQEQALLSQLAIASLLDEMGNVEEAEQKYAKVLEEHPDKPIANNNFSYFYAVHGRELDDALKMVQKALRVEPDTGAYLDTLGWVLYKQGKYRAAVYKINEAFQRQPDAVVAEHLGDALIKTGQPSLAIEKWKKALELDPDAKEVEKKIQDALKADAPAK